MTASSELYQKRFGELVARAWGDEDFKARLLADPRAVATEYDLPIPGGAEIRVHVNTERDVFMVLSTEPVDAVLEEIAQGPGGERLSRAVRQVVERSRSDAGYRARLISEPVATLAESGVVFPKGTSVRVLENSDTVFHLVIPAMPSDVLTEEQLGMVAGGADPNYSVATFGSLATIPSSISTAGTAGSYSSS